MLNFKKPKKFQIQKEVSEDYWVSILDSVLNSVEWRMDHINNIPVGVFSVNWLSPEVSTTTIYTNSPVNPSFYEPITITGVSIGGFYEQPTYSASIDPFVPNIGLTACTTTLMNESNI